VFALPATVVPVTGALVAAGTVAFAVNLLSVLHEHSPHSLAGVLFARSGSESDSGTDDGTGEERPA
jgi:hypothetical protein